VKAEVTRNSSSSICNRRNSNPATCWPTTPRG